jgi:ubiquinone biosynthesis protein UbiJ
LARPPELLFKFASKFLSANQANSANPLHGFYTEPVSLISAPVTQILCWVLNHLLDQQPTSQSRMQKESGKTLVLVIAPVKLKFWVNEQGHFQPIALNQSADDSVDTQITLEWADLIGSVSKPSAVSRKAVIEGNMNFAQTVSIVINDLSWDSERDLAQIVGDEQAVWIMNALSALGTNARDVLQRFKSSLHEYVVYEQSMTPTEEEFNSFCCEISQLRDDLARLEKRLSKLSTQFSLSSGDAP